MARATLIGNGQRLRAARAAQGWSQEDLEERSGVAKRTIERIEAVSDYHTTFVTLESLAGALGIAMRELVGPAASDYHIDARYRRVYDVVFEHQAPVRQAAAAVVRIVFRSARPRSDREHVAQESWTAAELAYDLARAYFPQMLATHDFMLCSDDGKKFPPATTVAEIVAAQGPVVGLFGRENPALGRMSLFGGGGVWQLVAFATDPEVRGRAESTAQRWLGFCDRAWFATHVGGPVLRLLFATVLSPVVWSLNNTAVCLAELDQDHELLERLARTLVRLRPRSATVADTVAWAHYRLGRPAEARDSLLEAMAASSSPSLENYYHLYFIHRALGETHLAYDIKAWIEGQPFDARVKLFVDRVLHDDDLLGARGGDPLQAVTPVLAASKGPGSPGVY
jgi:transcriptional regulator with XRE-family HTH domain